MATVATHLMKTTLPLGNGNSGSTPSFISDTVNRSNNDSEQDDSDSDTDDVNEITRRKYTKGWFLIPFSCIILYDECITCSKKSNYIKANHDNFHIQTEN